MNYYYLHQIISIIKKWKIMQINNNNLINKTKSNLIHIKIKIKRINPINLNF
jgi:hypothetical protein